MWLQYAVGVALLAAGIVFVVKRSAIERALNRFAEVAPRVTKEAPKMPARMLSIAYPIVLLLGAYLTLFEIR